MRRKCCWCGLMYDTTTGESSRYCFSNPDRERNLRRKRKPRWVKIAALTYHRPSLAGKGTTE